MSMIRYFKENLHNIPGWRTKRKIIIFESDDWGSIRIPSKNVFNTLLDSGIKVDKCQFCSFDSLESEDDLANLFQVLSSIKDHRGNHPEFTANTVVANPDFNKIKESGFKQYFYKTLTNATYDGKHKLLELYKQGREAGCFFNQSHGREHLNVKRWLKYLCDRDEDTLTAFELGVFGISYNITKTVRKSFLSAFEFENSEEEKDVIVILEDGLRIFEEIFGYKSLSFIAPNYTWSYSLEKVLKDNGVKYIQGGPVHRYLILNDQKERKRLRATGTKSKSGLINLARNAIFEPSLNNNYDWIHNCMTNINTAFRWYKPAIISTHRVNYVSTLDVRNRDRSLVLLHKLLTMILKKWPDVEFMTSNKLGDIILETHQGFYS